MHFVHHRWDLTLASGRGSRREHDPQLTAEGERQASSWRSQSRAWGITALLCSPLRRCLRTALLAFDETAPPIELRSWLREYHWEDPQNQGHVAEAIQAELGSICPYARTPTAWSIVPDIAARSGVGGAGPSGWRLISCTGQ